MRSFSKENLKEQQICSQDWRKGSLCGEWGWSYNTHFTDEKTKAQLKTIEVDLNPALSDPKALTLGSVPAAQL